MSRIGKKTIEIPQGATAEIKDSVLTVKGPKGTLTRVIHPHVTMQIVDNAITTDVGDKEEKKERALWGTFAAHARNMGIGVTQGYKKQLEINGVGYKVAMQGKDLKFEVGFSHPVIFKVPAEVVASVDKNVITLESFDKEFLGSTAAEIRSIKKPEPYKGKGIKYIEEVLRHKAGKTATKGA